MALAELSVVNNQIVVEVGGTALLAPLVTAAAGYASDAESARDAAEGFKDDASEILLDLTEDKARYVGDGPVHPLFIDSEDRVVLGVNTETNVLVGAGIPTTETMDGLISNRAVYTGSGTIKPIFLDQGGRVVLGVDTETNALVGPGIGNAAADTSIRTAEVTYNHLLFYGQSLSIGAAGGTVISSSQPYSNVTFNGGPRAWDGSDWDFGTLKPLVEDAVTPSPDGSMNRSETPCSGAANYASTYLAQNGIAPADHIILGSTAGRGGYQIDLLKPGSTWYENFLAHVSGAQALSTDHAVQAIGWLQGESDIPLETSLSTYYAALSDLRSNSEDQIKILTGQTTPVYLLTYQCSYGVTAHPDIALAQLALSQDSDRVFMVAPTYFLPYAADDTHLTAAGYKWIGAYFGRAYASLILGQAPTWLNPVSATYVDGSAEVRVRFDVPHLPLVLDTTAMAATTDHGFAVLDDGDAATINSVAVDGSEVVLTLSAAPTGPVTVRYALDYLGTGLTIIDGGSGNLRDSAPETTTISSVVRPLWNWSPAFQLTATPIEA